MSKPIKLDDDVYQELEGVRIDIETTERKSATKSDAVKHLLALRKGVVILINTIEGNKSYAEYKAKQLKTTVGGTAAQDQPKVPNV